jgi:hypothetical protein
MQLINQLANFEVQDREMFWNHIFDQTVGNPRAITELINRYRKEPFGHANNQGNSPLGRIARNRHDLDRNCFTRFAHFAALLSREMDEPALRFIGSMAMILLFWSAR